jgi:hypothetical protein
VRWRRPLAILTVLAAAEAPPAGAQGSRWSLDLGAQERYQTGGVNDARLGADFVTYFDARLGRRFPSRRGSLELGTRGGIVIDHRFGEVRSYTWDLSAMGSRALSRRGTLRGSVGSSLGFAHDVSRLDESGVVPPYSMARTDRASVELLHKLPGDLEGRIQGSGERFNFDRPDLVDGSTAGVEGDLMRGVGPRVRLGVAGGYRWTSTYGRKVEIGQVSGRVNVSATRTFTLGASAGMSRYAILDTGDEPRWQPTGAVSGAGRFGRHKVSAMLAQGVEQTYGIGTIGVVRSISIGYSYAVGTRFELHARASDTYVSETVVGEGPDRGRRYTAGFRYEFVRSVSGQVQYIYWRRVQEGVGESRTQAISASLRAHWGWR